MEYRIVERFNKYELQVKYSYFDGSERRIEWKPCCRGTQEFCERVYQLRKVG